ncbi:MAG: phosphopantothenoylcysteine decarboxylase [Candidatus Omnitrophota bacterium]|jgi:phosphopantothenoylcysteine decarboxylase/phosphopantothenate--cysteine ligase
MKVLITAGATWVKIDEARILTNRFSGKTGLYLAKALKNKGHKVTLIINPHCVGEVKGPKAVCYHYFSEFKAQVLKCLREEKFDAIIHTAAVSDYCPKNTFKGKAPSGKSKLRLELVPLPKVITSMRRLAPKAKIIQFKLQANRKNLIQAAFRSLKENKSDFVVANSLKDLSSGCKRFVINGAKEVVSVNSQKQLALVLDKIVRASSPQSIKAKVEK